MAEKFS